MCSKNNNVNSIHLFITVEEQNGEYRYTIHHLTTVNLPSDHNSIKTYCEKFAKETRSEYSHSIRDWHYYNTGEIGIRLYNFKQVTESEYQVLRKFI